VGGGIFDAVGEKAVGERDPDREELPNTIGVLTDREVGVEDHDGAGECETGDKGREEGFCICGVRHAVVCGGEISGWGGEVVDEVVDWHYNSSAFELGHDERYKRTMCRVRRYV
jgi:hypothetical protein